MQQPIRLHGRQRAQMPLVDLVRQPVLRQKRGALNDVISSQQQLCRHLPPECTDHTVSLIRGCSAAAGMGRWGIHDCARTCCDNNRQAERLFHALFLFACLLPQNISLELSGMTTQSALPRALSHSDNGPTAAWPLLGAFAGLQLNHLPLLAFTDHFHRHVTGQLSTGPNARATSAARCVGQQSRSWRCCFGS